MSKHCQCFICKHGRRYYRIIKGLPKSQHKFMSEHYDGFLNVAEDNEVKGMILDGDWPSAVEQLTVALAKAKIIRAKELATKMGKVVFTAKQVKEK